MIKKLTVTEDELKLVPALNYFNAAGIKYELRCKETQKRKSKSDDSEELIAIREFIYPVEYANDEGVLMTATEITSKLSSICGELYKVDRVGACLRLLNFERKTRSGDRLKCYKVKFR